MRSASQQAVRDEGILASRAAYLRAETVPEYPQASYYSARYYDSSAGRFLSEDPIHFRAGINFYRYARNSTINQADPTGLYTLENFPPAEAAQMTIAIGRLVAKLNSSCCIDPDVRRRILNHLQPSNYGQGATFTFYPKIIFNNKPVDGQVGPLHWFTEQIAISGDAFNSSCPLEGIILHELVHLTWHNGWIALKTSITDPDAAERDAYEKSSACFGPACQESPEP